MNRESVDAYLARGCGRCEKFDTPQCKVHRWNAELTALRALLREGPLVEEMKWGSPCYTLDGRNVVMLGALKDAVVLSFFEGHRLRDEEGVLETAGPNSLQARQVRVRSLEEVETVLPALRGFLAQAVELARQPPAPRVRAAPGEPPPELAARLAEEAELRRAWEALTPGRQRSHILHIQGGKAEETRRRRVEACLPWILDGRGFKEREEMGRG